MTHEDIPYYHNGIQELDEETYALLKVLALTYGQQKPIELSTFNWFTKEITPGPQVNSYQASWELPDIQTAFHVVYVHSLHNMSTHEQVELLVTETIGDEKEINQHIYRPDHELVGTPVVYQQMAVQHTEAFLEEQAAWHAEIDARRPPAQPGELRVYPVKGGDTDGIAQEKEFRLYLLQQAEEILRAN